MDWRLGLHIILVLLISGACTKGEKKHAAEVYGHAGGGISKGRYIYPPNSAESISYAFDVLNADGVEVDVRLTKDSSMVLFHDSGLELETDGVGCVEQYTLAELKELNYADRYEIITLTEALHLSSERNRSLFLDLKTVAECGIGSISEEWVNKGFEEVEEFLENHPLPPITVNSKSLSVLSWIDGDVFLKSFETENIEVGIEQYQADNIDKLTVRLDWINNEQANLLRNLQIPFCIFGIKTQKEIREAYGLLPTEMISDNVAFTKKIMR